MYTPASHDEATGYAEYVDQQLEALRASAFGLTEEQARLTPTRSALSIGGIIKHTSHVILGPHERGDGAIPEGGGVSKDQLRAFTQSFVLLEEESFEATLATFDARRARIIEWIATTDPDTVVTQPPAPWYGQMTSTRVRLRYQHGHLIEELARHAGHADIIREEIDGASAGSLLLAVLGLEATPFISPWRSEQTVG